MVLLPAVGEVSVDVKSYRIYNIWINKFATIYFAVLLHLRNMFATGSPTRSPARFRRVQTFSFISWTNRFLLQCSKSGLFFCCRKVFFCYIQQKQIWPFKMTDPTAGNLAVAYPVIFHAFNISVLFSSDIGNFFWFTFADWALHHGPLG
jgi:hypothetical protein